MDPTTASYYRAILFVDSQDARPLPPTLVQLHNWAVKRNHALGLGGMITKAFAWSVAMTWLSSTKDGQEFASAFTPLGDLFGEDGSDELSVELSDDLVVSAEDWDSIPADTELIVTMKDKSTKVAEFIGRRGNWIDVRVNGEVQHFRTNKVKIAAECNL